MSRYSIYPCTFNDGTARNVQQMDSFGVKTAANKSHITPGGSLDRAHTGLASANPMATFSTRDLAGMFGFTSATVGLACSGGATFRKQLRVDGGTFATGANHKTYTSTKGFLKPVSLSAGQQDADGAQLSMEYYALWDGSTNPFAENANVNYSTAPTPAFNSRFFLGPIYHNSVQIGCIERWSLNFGIEYRVKSFDGEPFARIGSVIARNPTLTFTTANDAETDGIDLFINAVNTSMAFYLQRGAANDDRVAAGTSQHLKVTVSSGSWCLDESSVQGNEDGTNSFTVEPTGTIALSVASPIP